MTTTVHQQHFAAALLVPAMDVPVGLTAAAAGNLDQRFAVHRNNVVSGLVEALVATFPVSRALVGDAFFRAMARERVFADPPRSPVLTDYAVDFPVFVAGFAPAATVPYLADVARLEALRVRAYHSADAAPLAEAAYRELLAAPESLAATRLAVHPSACWLRSNHAAHSIWSAHHALQDPSAATLDGIDIEQAQAVLVVRPAFDVEVALLPNGAIEFLDALGAGQTLASALARAHAIDDDVDSGALFALLVRHGLAVGIEPALEQ